MDRTIALLHRLLPSFVAEPLWQGAGDSRASRIALPTANGADYYFELWIEPEMQISAQTTVESSDYFWCMPFESAAFSGSMEKLEQAFCETVEKLLRHETRVIQRNGRLNWHFRCDYRTHDRWERVYSHSALKVGGFKAPKIDGKSKTYHSAALVRSV